MKVHIIFVLSVVGLSSARYVKWSPSDVDGHQDFKEDFHQFWSHLGDLLAEQDEQDLKEFLHQAFQMHRPIHDENNFNHNMVKPNRPYHHNSRPSYNDQENIMRPLHHEDFDTASQEVIDEEIVRPSSYLRDVEMEMNNAKQPLPQRPLRPFHNHPDQFDEDKYVMRPLHDLLAEIDGEMEQSLPENHIMRPLGPVEIEEIDNAMRPLPQKPLRPFHNRPGHVDGEKYVMRPLHDIQADTDSEVQHSLPQIHIMRPVRPIDVAEEMDNVMRPLPQKPLRPLPNRPDEIDEEKYVMRPLQDLSAEIDREMEQSLPQNHIMRPLGPVEIEEMQCHATITRSSS
ncbi:uncharacterized protein LOC119066152 isoform X1 [Bradysia coprophila]|uniref:uncharacterized protein LOC119066152 isoform X1 n=1 Tax=Bradysia coprophila TaxID=38358 RepID=UPI00187DA76B|nr:uncharacterized protein LOC119066152 isoform X1 [Bradysia coprophila]